MRAIDLFAGAGGFTTGAVAAGIRVIWAANHWPAAVACHKANHPDTEHLTQDLHQANWASVPSHDLLLASPQCSGHAKARGKERPHHDAARSTAWAIVSAAETCRPAFAIVENVPEFEGWLLYPEWSAAMVKLGYACARYVIDAADFGVPQHRRRLFLVFSRSKHPVKLDLPTLPHRPVSEVIDFASGVWSLIEKPRRAANTLARIDAGRRVHGQRFAISYYGNSKGGHSLNLPLGTLTTHDRYALIDGDMMRMLTVDESKAIMSFPETYRLPGNRATAIKLLGNAVAPTVSETLCTALQKAA